MPVPPWHTGKASACTGMQSYPGCRHIPDCLPRRTARVPAAYPSHGNGTPEARRRTGTSGYTVPGSRDPSRPPDNLPARTKAPSFRRRTPRYPGSTSRSRCMRCELLLSPASAARPTGQPHPRTRESFPGRRSPGHRFGKGSRAAGPDSPSASAHTVRADGLRRNHSFFPDPCAPLKLPSPGASVRLRPVFRFRTSPDP